MNSQYVLKSSRGFFQPTRTNGLYIRLFLLLLLFFTVGLVLHAWLAPVMESGAGFAPGILMFTQPETDKHFLQIAASAWKITVAERRWLLAAFIASLTYFCPVVTRVFLAIYGISLGLQIGAVCVNSQLLPHNILLCFILYAISTTAILYGFIKADITFRTLHGIHNIALTWRTLLWFIGRILITYLCVFITAFIFFLIFMK